MNIHRALSDLADIRAQLARTEQFRGFRSTALGLSSLVVLVGYVVAQQRGVLASESPSEFLVIWLGVALVSAAIAGAEMLIRATFSQQPAVWQMHRQLAIRLAPALVVGVTLTVALAMKDLGKTPSGVLWMLPGLWAMIYGLGLYCCSPQLPRMTDWVAGYFLVSGAVVLADAALHEQALGWHMLVTFAAGQVLMSVVLYLNLHEEDAR